MSVNSQQLAEAIDKLNSLERDKCIDAFDLQSRPTDTQDRVFRDAANITARYVVAGNQSGKSVLGGRETAWVFEGKHPYWDTAKQFGDRPLLLLVIGRVGEQVESELWARKIRPFLEPGSYKEVRTGNSLQRVVHNKTKNTIIFLSHHNVREAREKVQSYTAAYVWLDEMVASVSFLSELLLRIQANNGRLLATFTPLLRSKEVKDLVESARAPSGRKYQFGMLDNPIYKGREKEILQQFAGLSADERAARLHGEWFRGGRHVYKFDQEELVEPEEYHPNWPHLEIVDPAVSGKAGYLLLANRPGTGIWYPVKAEYISGEAPTVLIDSIQKLSQGYNIVRRVSDPHETWFITQAALQGIYYGGVYKKNERKHELIKQSQEALREGRVILTTWVPKLTDEMDVCMWNEETDKIIGASRFHLLDCLQYGIDNLPPASENLKPKSWHQELKDANRERKKREKIKIQRARRKSQGISKHFGRRRRKWI